MHDPESPDPELYVLPDLADIEYWDRVQAAGLHQPAPTTNGAVKGTWAWVNLADPEYAIPPDPPAIHGLLYAGKRHVLSGPQESAKTLVAYWLLLQALEQGHQVAILDFEMGPVATRRMLSDLGATPDQLPLVAYTEPTGPPTDADIERLTAARTDYVLVDASAGAFDTSGLDDNSRKDAERFARQWIQPLFANGIATIVLDHVTKNSETRGKYAIGSERKTGGADVHLGFEALKTLTRGGTGIVKVTAHKDRGAYMQRPTVALIKLASDADTHAVTITIEAPEPAATTDTGQFRHTIVMEKVSRALEANNHEPMSGNELETACGGKREIVRAAILELTVDGYLAKTKGAYNANLYTLIKQFRKDEYDLAPSSPLVRPGEPTPLVRPLALPLQGDEARGELVEANGGPPSSPQTGEPSMDVYDPTIQHLLDDDIPW